MKKLQKIMMFSLLSAMGANLFAANLTATQKATATLTSSCTVSAANVVFGNIAVAATGTQEGNGSVTSLCTKGTSYTLSLSRGQGIDYNNRVMSGKSGNSDKLRYQLYQDANHTPALIWGEAGSAVSLVGTGSAQTSTIYGLLNLNQYVTPDNYSDTTTVTLVY